ncbi:hypothetical protein MPSEU_000038300 [Mayamaea pseudoterrestris]|nr:hypothetical protein MPSEU_000038300 [Mayamaea pseudoterrestris]
MGWSPIHALRIHIWAGYCSFLMAMSHTVTMFVVFWGFDKIPLRDQFIPKAECWAKDANFTLAEGEMHPPPEADCLWQWWNLTGGFAALFLVILWATSINWVRRKNYRVFYVCHVVFGTLLILATFLHFDFCAIYMLPSTAYYIAATAPSLIQALASRFRGGNKIVKVVALQDAGGCVEFHVATDSEAGKVISTETNLYVKLCVPKNSLIWHPFTVYQHPADHNIVRVLFRPVGPFTKLLSLHLTAPERPVTILDGFYRGSDRVAHSLLHDHVTIIAGGVAITSFLSFVPRLLDAVAMQSKEIRLLNSITLHWAVRETGLEKYILKEFLRVFMAKANVIDGLDFQIKIHCTGRKATAVATEGKDIESSDDGAEPAIAVDETSSGSDSAELIKEDTQAAVVHDIANDTGFAMELARTMPARFTEMQRNIPYAAGFVGFMWLGFHLTFFQYSWNDDINYAGLTKVTWYTILFVVLSVVYGAVVEGGELLYRKYVPAPHADDFIVEQGIKTLDDETNAAVLFDSAKLSKTFGRPTPELLLSEASNSEAPGIFLCGPTALCHDVFKEARKENSFLGLTRYCIYDEPFEM